MSWTGPRTGLSCIFCFRPATLSASRRPGQLNRDQGEHHEQAAAHRVLPRTLHPRRPKLRGEDHNCPVNSGSYHDIEPAETEKVHAGTSHRISEKLKTDVRSWP